MYYSWFNITSNNKNDSFQIIWPICAGTSNFTLTLPNGFYDVYGLISYFQQFFITDGLYLINESGNYVFYAELKRNSNYYSVRFYKFPIPTSLPVV